MVKYFRTDLTISLFSSGRGQYDKDHIAFSILLLETLLNTNSSLKSRRGIVDILKSV